MEQGIIDNIVSSKVFSELEKLESSISKIIEMSGKVQIGKGGRTDAGVSFEKLAKEQENLIKQSQRLQRELENTAAATSRRIAADENSAKATTLRKKAEEDTAAAIANRMAKEDAMANNSIKYAKQQEILSNNIKSSSENAAAAAARRALAEDKLAKGIQSLSREQKLSQQIVEAATGSYNQLQAQLSLNTIKYKALSEEERNNAQIGGVLTAENLKINTTLKQLDATMGVHNRNVGHYERSMFGMTQILREMPNFAIDARIGFMSLSNNLPMLADEFKRVSQTMVEVKDKMGNITQQQAGWKAGLKAMGASIISVNALLVLLSTALVLWGDDLVDFITKTEGAEKAQDEFNKTIKDGSSTMNSSVESFLKMQASIDLAKKGIISKDKAVTQYKETLSGTLGVANTFNEVEDKMKNISPDYVKAMYLMAKANAILAFATKEAAKEEMLRQQAADPITFGESFVNGLKRTGKLIKDYFTNFGGVQNFVMYKDYFKDIFNADEYAITQRNNAIKKAGEDSKKSFASYMKAFEDAAKFSKEKGIDIFGGKNTEDSIKATTETAKVEAEKAVSYIETIYKSIAEGAKAGAENEKNSYEDRIEYAKNYVKLLVGINSDIYRTNISNLNAERDAKIANGENKLNVDKWYSSEKDKIDAESYEKYQDTLSKGIELYKTINDYKIKQDEALNKEALKNADNYLHELLDKQDKTNRETYEKELELERQKSDVKRDIIRQSFDLSYSIADAYFKWYEDKLDEQKDKLAETYDFKLQQLQDSNDQGIISDQQYEEQRKDIEAQRKAEEDKIEKDRKKAERNAFLIKQAIALGEVAINTAVNISKNPLMAIPYAALGALQAATIAAQSIPYFAEGGEMKHSGLAVEGDAGKHELNVLPDGSMFISNNVPTMYNIPKGTKIYPDINNLPEKIQSMVIQANVTNDNKELERKVDILIREIRKSRGKGGDSLHEKVIFARKYNN